MGKKHVAIGVPIDSFPVMGESLIETLRENLGKRFTPEIERSWWIVYNALSAEIVEAMKAEK